jgi:hypothetical protein
MRVLIDEDTAVQLLAPLSHVLHMHRVDHVTKIGWAAKKNRSVLADAKAAGSFYGRHVIAAGIPDDWAARVLNVIWPDRAPAQV